MFSLKILAPKTKTAAVIVLVSCVTILISYYLCESGIIKSASIVVQVDE
jgi:hypothetical protein